MNTKNNAMLMIPGTGKHIPKLPSYTKRLSTQFARKFSKNKIDSVGIPEKTGATKTGATGIVEEG